MSPRAFFALAAGVALFTGVLVWQGVGSVLAAFAGAGWGLVLVAAFHLVPLVLDTAGLGVLIERSSGFGVVMRARWAGESVNGLLPVAQMGGEVAKLRVLTRAGISGSDAAAAVIASVTLAAAAQIVFALIGIGLLAGRVGAGVLAVLMAGIAGLAALVLLFYRIQQRGLFSWFARTGREWFDLSGGAWALDRALHSVYGRRRAALASFALHLIGWIAGLGEVWLALYFLGHPVSWTEALLLESLGQAVRGMAFAIPGALGVQEGGYLFLGALVGLPADTALALSLAKRGRELLLGIPGLIYWQVSEGRMLRRRGRAAQVVD